MDIGQNIREKRKELGYTQEQIADLLNVSPSAVNKWERGNTYPDITLLPALARLLKTDLNTLMSFEERLSSTEIYLFLNHLDPLIQEKGYETGFRTAMEKIRDFPNCEPMMLNIALYLDGALSFFNVADRKPYEEELEKIYLRLKNSSEEAVRIQALKMLFFRHMARGEYDAAEALIGELPDGSESREALLIPLKIRQGALAEASALLENRVVKSAAELQSALINMLDIAFQENRREDAHRLASLYGQAARLFGLEEFTFYTAEYELAVREQNAGECLRLLKLLLPAMQENHPVNTDLYPHFKPSGISSKILPSFLEELRSREEMAFLRDNPELLQLLEEFQPPIEP